MNDGVVRPRAFISHASEDKPFVINYGQELFKNGIEAWVDEWELNAGDSLIQRILDEGIDRAQAFIAVISRNSVVKPWVREELDAGMVRRIDGQCRLIPVILDDVAVPAPLRHIVWLSVRKLGVDGVIAETVRIVHGRASLSKPPLGSPPKHLSAVVETAVWRGVSDPADQAVLAEIMAELRRSPGARMTTNAIQERCRAAGIDAATFQESMFSLKRTGLVKADNVLNSTRWWLLEVAPAAWLDAEAANGVDVDEMERRLLIAIVNDDSNSRNDPATYLGVHRGMANALLDRLQQQELLTYRNTGHGPVVTTVNPLARRVVRDSH